MCKTNLLWRFWSNQFRITVKESFANLQTAPWLLCSFIHWPCSVAMRSRLLCWLCLVIQRLIIRLGLWLLVKRYNLLLRFISNKIYIYCFRINFVDEAVWENVSTIFKDCSEWKSGIRNFCFESTSTFESRRFLS